MRVLVTTCLLCFFAGTGSGQPYPWCSNMDNIFAEIDDGNLVLHHENITYNCCPDSITFTTTTSNDSLFVTEREVLTNPCDCMCCYDVSVTVEGLSQGEWHVVYRWFDDDPWVWRDLYLDVTINDPAPPGPARIVGSGASGCLDPSGVPEDIPVPGPGIELMQNTPNPFNPQTTISFEIPGQAAVNLLVYDVSGRLIRVLIDNGIVGPGRHEAVWNGRDDTGRKVATGVYFYRLETGKWSETKRMVLMN